MVFSIIIAIMQWKTFDTLYFEVMDSIGAAVVNYIKWNAPELPTTGQTEA